MSFVHLHTHSHYSLLESSSKHNELVDLCVKHKMPAAAITDNGNMFGVIDWHYACKEKNIKPIIGIDVYIAPNGRLSKTRRDIPSTNGRLVLLAKNYDGYRQLCKISTVGFKEGFYYKPRVDYEVLKKYNQNIICLTGGITGEVCKEFLSEGKEKALQKIDLLKSIYKDLYLEIQSFNKVNEFLLEASKLKSIPLVATNDVHFTTSEDHLTREALYCIGVNSTLSDRDDKSKISKECYFKSPDQMKELFADLPEAIENTLNIANMCATEFDVTNKDGTQKYHMPGFKSEKVDELKTLTLKGLEKRLKESNVKDKDLYYDRVENELKVIKACGFVGYFLIVQDFVRWAREQGIPVGPGRGSGAGSLVAYSLMITDLDPIKHNLIFERFLNQHRVSLPDFDIDFCQQRRGEVIDYVTKKYGEECVSQIITYGKLQARAAIRDVGRVLGIEYSQVDVVARLIPEELGITIKSALKKESRLKELMEDDPKINQLINIALKIEGLNRHVSVHAAGIIISDVSLLENAPLYKGKDDETIIQYDMRSSEKIGFVKFDFLGLKTLTHIDNTFKLIKKTKNKTVTSRDISLSDKGIYQMISSGSTKGIFQFESPGITELILRVKPTSFDDITAINALYRPGPMRMLDEYIKRKHDRTKIKYIFEELKEILKPTYGIIVYQEQVQLIAYKIANFTLGEADILRRAMGKKKKRDMQIQRRRFIEGALKNGFDRKKSEELFDLMARFAEYGFNKSHAAAYCVITAQTAWLKKYYPTEFFTTLLSTEINNSSKIIQYIKDAKQNGVTVKPPCVNKSEYEFVIVGDNIYFGLGAIKTVGQPLAFAIVEARNKLKDKRFNSVLEFFETIDSKVLNKKSIEHLILSGSFDCFGLPRDQLMNSHQYFISRVNNKKNDQAVGQVNFFETQDTVIPKEDRQIRWSRIDRLKHEKESLGFYFTDHPLRGFENILQKLAPDTINLLAELQGVAYIGGIVTEVNERVTKNGNLMAFVTIEDLTGSTEVVVFPDLYSHIKFHLLEDSVVFFRTLSKDSSRGSRVVADKFYTLDEKLEDANCLCINLDQDVQPKFLDIKNILKKHTGKKKVVFRTSLKGQYIDSVSKDPEGVVTNKELINELITCISKSGAVDIL